MSSRTNLINKARRRLRRKRHVRSKLFGTSEKPRLTVFRSHQNIYCQVVDDVNGKTLASASTRDKELRGSISGFAGNSSAATEVGKAVAEKIKALGIKSVQFDRNGYKFHGRVKALVEATREAGIKV